MREAEAMMAALIQPSLETPRGPTSWKATMGAARFRMPLKKVWTDMYSATRWGGA